LVQGSRRDAGQQQGLYLRGRARAAVGRFHQTTDRGIGTRPGQRHCSHGVQADPRVPRGRVALTGGAENPTRKKQWGQSLFP